MKNSINDVMVSMLALGAVDRGLEPWWGQTRFVKLVLVASPLNMQH